MEHHFGPPQSSSTPVMSYNEVEELNHILEVERELVLKTQDNYRQLKEKYVELQDEYGVLQKEHESLRTGNINSERLQRSFHDLEEKSKELIRQLEEDNKEREIRYELFKANTLSELQKVFRKELSDQESQIEDHKREKEELVEENDRLLKEITNMKTEKRTQDQEWKRRERRMREELDDQMAKMLEKLEEKGNNTNNNSELIDSYRSQIIGLEKKLCTVEMDSAERVSERNDKITHLERALEEERGETMREKSKAEQYRHQCHQMKQQIHRKDDELQSLHRRYNDALKERIKIESEYTLKEQRQSGEIGEQATVFEQKLSKLEVIFKEKDEIVGDLRKQLASLEEAGSSQMARVAEREELGLEINQLKDKAEKQRRERESQTARHAEDLRSLQIERNKLQEAVLELRKKLETSPETISKIKRLRDQLEKKDETMREVRLHYRELIKRMKTSLVNLEKRHRRAQEKLNSQILIP